MIFLESMLKISLFFTLLIFSAGARSEWGDRRKPMDYNRIPREQNKKSIMSCLTKLKDLISDKEASSLDALKTMIERMYVLNKSYIKYRELYYKTQAGEKWRAEFYLTPDSVWGREKYKLKFFKGEARDGGYVYLEADPPTLNLGAPSPNSPSSNSLNSGAPSPNPAQGSGSPINSTMNPSSLNSPLKESVLDKSAALKFAQDQEVETDERWESFFAPKEPLVKFKSKNFKLFELSVEWSGNHTSALNCTMVSEQPVCQCLSAQ